MGATNDTLVVTNITAADAGDYWVVVTDQVGSVTSDTATLTLLIPPIIIQHPQSQTVTVGDTVTFSVTVTNTATLPIGYRWRQDFWTRTNQVLNQRTASYTINNVQTNHAGLYTVAITNAASHMPGELSIPAELTVLEE